RHRRTRRDAGHRPRAACSGRPLRSGWRLRKRWRYHQARRSASDGRYQAHRQALRGAVRASGVSLLTNRSGHNITGEQVTTTQIYPEKQPASHAARGNNLFLYVCVFISGMTTLATEMLASRLLGSVFGTSNLVWANVIGLMLLYLTIGYTVGGRWADRSPHRQTFYHILVWGAFLNALIPLASRPVLTAAAQAVVGAQAALALGSFVSVLVLFAIPITLLGTVSPFAIRLAVRDVDSAGQTSGRIDAISTLGSLIGTVLPG